VSCQRRSIRARNKFREYPDEPTRSRSATPSKQRDMVRYIFSQHNHFDADQLDRGHETAGFAVSRATVYRTLAKLVDAGLRAPRRGAAHVFTSTTTATRSTSTWFANSATR